MADIEISTLGGVIKTAYEGQPNTNAFTDAEKSKLADMASNAQLRDRSTHTGVQTASTIVDLPDVLATKLDAVPGKTLSDVNFTQAEKEKLASLEDAHFKGVHVGLSGLQTAHPTGTAGDYAVVDDGTDLTWYQWDDEWVARVGESTEVTPAQVKSYYESNPDTNAYTDAEKAIVASLGGPGRFSLRRVGTWNAATNTPALLDGTGANGDYYVVTTAGTQYFGPGNRRFELYDWVFFAGGVWNRLPAGDHPVTQWTDVTGKPDFDALYAKKGRGGLSAPIQAAYVWSNVATSVPTGTTIPLVPTTSSYDYFSMLSGGVLTIPAWATRIRVSGNVSFDANPNGYRYVGCTVGGSVISTTRTPALSGTATSINFITPVWPVTGGRDLIINLYQNSGTALNASTASWINVELFEAN